MRKYTFDLMECSIAGFQEIDLIIPAESLTDAVRKFTRKHELEAPAYWDEPAYETVIELTFKHQQGVATYRITW